MPTIGVTESESAAIEDLRLALASKQQTVDALMKRFRPLDFPVVAGLIFDVLYQPGATIEHLGGDWYDVFMHPDGRIAFTLATSAAEASLRQ